MQRYFLFGRHKAAKITTAGLTSIDEIIDHVGREHLERMIFAYRSNVWNIYRIIMEKDIDETNYAKLCRNISTFMFANLEIDKVCEKRYQIKKESKNWLPDMIICALFGFVDRFDHIRMSHLPARIDDNMKNFVVFRGNNEEKVDLIRYITSHSLSGVYNILRDGFRRYDNMDLFYRCSARNIIDRSQFISYLLLDDHEIVAKTIKSFGGNAEAARLYLRALPMVPFDKTKELFDNMNMTLAEVAEIHKIANETLPFFANLHIYLRDKHAQMILPHKIFIAAILINSVNKNVLAAIMEECLAEMQLD